MTITDNTMTAEQKLCLIKLAMLQRDINDTDSTDLLETIEYLIESKGFTYDDMQSAKIELLDSDSLQERYAINMRLLEHGGLGLSSAYNAEIQAGLCKLELERRGIGVKDYR